MKFLIIFALLFSQIAFAQQEVGQRTSALEKNRADLEGLIDRRTYTEDDHKVMKTYFSSVNSFVADLGSYPRYVRRFNSYVRSVGVETFCGNVFLDLLRWKGLVSNCTKNGYFLCSDEVMTFSETKKKLSDKLETDLKGEFEKLEKCR